MVPSYCRMTVLVRADQDLGGTKSALDPDYDLRPEMMLASH